MSSSQLNSNGADHLEFRLLGPFEVLGRGEPIVVGGRRQAMVLAVLALNPGKAVSQDRLMESVWGDEPPASSARTLHAYISRLRAALRTETLPPNDVLVRRGQGYLLDVRPDLVDVERFERLVSQGSAAMVGGRPEDAGRDLRGALALWRGRALGEFADERFGVTESLRLEERRREAQELCMEAELAQAHHSALVAELEGLVYENPLRERFWGQLMTALYRCDRQADALSTYQRLRRHLVDELGLEPAPELRRMEQLILDHSPELDWQPQTTGPRRSTTRDAPTPANPEPLPFVGRQQQRDQLLGMVTRTESGVPPQLAVVLGRPGYGKSRLLAEVCAAATNTGVLVARGTAEGDGAMWYRPFSDLVRSIITAAKLEVGTDRNLPQSSELAWLVPELGPPPATSGGDLDLARGRMVEAILGLFASVGEGEPLLIGIDDAHRLGNAGTALLREILDRPWPRSLTVLLCGRPSPPGPEAVDYPLDGMLRREHAVVVELNRFSTPDLEELLSRLGRDIAGERLGDFVSTLVEQTGGIPLLVREVLARQSTSGIDAGESELTSPLVQAVIGSHLAELSAPARRLLEVATVIGLEFDAGIVAAMSGLRSTEVVDLLDEARARGFVVELDRFEGFAFDHRLIMEVLSGSLSSSRRIRLHGAAAEALSSIGRPVEAAHHGLEGRVVIGDERTAVHALDGASHALTSLDFELARELSTRAVDDCTEASVERQIDLLVTLGQATVLCGELEKANEFRIRAADLARTSGDGQRLCDVALAGRTEFGRMLTGTSVQWNLLNEALETTAGAWTAKRLRVAAAWTSEACIRKPAIFDPALRAEMVDVAQSWGDPELLAEVTMAAYNSSLLLAERRPWAVTLRKVAEELDDNEWRYRATHIFLTDSVIGGDGEQTRRELAEHRRLTAHLRSPRSQWMASLAEASWATFLGEFAEGQRHADAALAMGQRYGLADATVAYGANLFTATYHRGQLAGLRLVLAQDDPGEMMIWSLGRGIAALLDSDIDEAALVLEDAMSRIPSQPDSRDWVLSLCLASEIAVSVADQATVEQLTILLGPYAGQIATAGAFAADFGPTDRCLGNLVSRQGDFVRAEAHFDRALSICEQMGANPWYWNTAADQFVASRAAGLERSPWGDVIETALEEAELNHALSRVRTAH